MSLKRHVLQVVALVTAVALVFGVFAGSASAKKISKAQKAHIRASLRKQVKKNPGVVRRRAFLRRAALVNFKLPVTIRLRNPCTQENGANPYPTTGGVPNGQLLEQNCLTQGTALNQRSIPTAQVNLGPSLGTRSVAIGGSLAAVVEFQDTYDGGALGNVNIKILPNGNKALTTSSVPLLWNPDISRATTRSDHNFAASVARPGNPEGYAALQPWVDSTFPWINGPTGPSVAYTAGGIPAGIPSMGEQGCGDWTTGNGNRGVGPYTPSGIVPAGYNSLFYGAPTNAGYGTFAGVPGYQVDTTGGSASGLYLPVYPGINTPNNIQAGAVVGNNDWIGMNPNPFPTGSAPTTAGGTPDPSLYNGMNTVLRTNALSLTIAPGNVSVNMSTGTATTPGGLTTAQGSQDVTLGNSGGQANLFGNIPGKNVGIDVTVNLATKINSIVRVMDQDVYKQPALIEGENFPAGIFNCAQIVTGAVQNYIPGVRLTGSLRIAPAITKDGKVRIAKATVQSDVNNPDRVALSACLFPAKPYNDYIGTSTDASAAKVPTVDQVTGGGSPISIPPGLLMEAGNTWGPLQDKERYPNLAEGNAPSTVPCGSDGTDHGTAGGAPYASPSSATDLADIIRQSGLTGTVSGLPTPSDPAYAGVQYRGDQASVAGDITVNPLDVDVLLGDQ